MYAHMPKYYPCLGHKEFNKINETEIMINFFYKLQGSKFGFEPNYNSLLVKCGNEILAGHRKLLIMLDY